MTICVYIYNMGVSPYITIYIIIYIWGFPGMGGTPIAGWVISWKIQSTSINK